MNDIDTGNKFMVGSNGDRLRILNLPALTSGLDKSDALLLAAWLVALSGAEREEFVAVLDAVEST